MSAQLGMPLGGKSLNRQVLEPRSGCRLVGHHVRTWSKRMANTPCRCRGYFYATNVHISESELRLLGHLVAHDCGHPLSHYTCRATRVAADFLDLRVFCRCSSGVAPHRLNILVSHLPPPPFPGGVAPKLGSEKVSRYTGLSQVQLRVSRYTVRLSLAKARLGKEESGDQKQFCKFENTARRFGVCRCPWSQVLSY